MFTIIWTLVHIWSSFDISQLVFTDERATRRDYAVGGDEADKADLSIIIKVMSNSGKLIDDTS